MTASSLPLQNQLAAKQANDDLSTLLREFKEFAAFIIDTNGYVVSWNEGAANIYGYTAPEVLGQHISLFYTSPEVQQNIPDHNLAKAKELGRFEHEELKFKKDGTRFYAQTVLTPLHNEDGTIKGFAKITRDITVQKKLDEENQLMTTSLEEKVQIRTRELEIVNQELEAFSYSVSHDLKAPLRTISGYASMLKEDYEGKLDTKAERIIDVIVKNTGKMRQLIDDLVDFSHIARLELLGEAVDMKTIAEKSVTEILQAETIKPKVILNDIPACKGDASMLNQVWMNLISNAVKYSAKKENPIIEVGVKDDDLSNIYYVKDNGTGFDMKYYDKLFGVFQRLHRSDEYEGTGLGLALAKRIISKHGGEIWGEASLNEGATFYFSIPK